MKTTNKILGSLLLGLVVALAALPSSAGGPDCDAANKELGQAQAALSKATRDADQSADAYAQCMSKGGNCASKKSAYDVALAAKAKAQAAMKAASSHVKTACN